MPFKCEQRSGKWVCFNTESGDVKGKHDTKGECEAQKRALYANTKDK